MAGMLDGNGTPDDPDPVNRQSAKLQVLVLRAAPADLTTTTDAAFAALLEMPPPTPTTLRTSALWKRYAEASPITYVSLNDPPTLLIHGDADPVVPYTQAINLDAALRKVGVRSRIVTIPNGVHGFRFGLGEGAPTPPNWPDYLGEMVRWFDQHLKDAKATD